MAEREVYARAWVTYLPGVEMSVGVAIRNESGPEIREMTMRLYELAFDALFRGMDVYTDAPAYVEQKIHEYWVGRPYFIESEEDGRGVQVFQPWGIPVDHVAVASPASKRLVVPVDLSVPAGATHNPPAPRITGLTEYLPRLTGAAFDLTGEEP